MRQSVDLMNPIREIINPKTGKVDVSGKRRFRFLQYLAKNEYTILRQSTEGQKLIKKLGKKNADKRLWQMAFKKSKAIEKLEKAEEIYKYRRRQLKKSVQESYEKWSKNGNLDRFLSYYGLSKII